MLGSFFFNRQKMAKQKKKEDKTNKKKQGQSSVAILRLSKRQLGQCVENFLESKWPKLNVILKIIFEFVERGMDFFFHTNLVCLAHALSKKCVKTLKANGMTWYDSDGKLCPVRSIMQVLINEKTKTDLKKVTRKAARQERLKFSSKLKNLFFEKHKKTPLKIWIRFWLKEELKKYKFLIDFLNLAFFSTSNNESSPPSPFFLKIDSSFIYENKNMLGHHLTWECLSDMSHFKSNSITVNVENAIQKETFKMLSCLLPQHSKMSNLQCQ